MDGADSFIRPLFYVMRYLRLYHAVFLYPLLEFEADGSKRRDDVNVRIVDPGFEQFM
jgi:hypothetical protein